MGLAFLENALDTQLKDIAPFDVINAPRCNRLADLQISATPGKRPLNNEAGVGNRHSCQRIWDGYPWVLSGFVHHNPFNPFP